MANKGSQKGLGATVPAVKPGDYLLGSRQSRAAARALLEARKAGTEDELHFQLVSILDGEPVNLEDLADRERSL